MSPSKPNKGDILIVDDQLANLKVLTSILTEKGYQVRQAINGDLALRTVHKSPPDLILLDIRMPDIDGYEVCKRLKADEKTRDIPIIFISVLEDAQDKIKAFAAGGVDYVAKPLQEEEVLVRVETHLALRAIQKQLLEKNVQLGQEIAERKQTEQSLRESEERFRLAFENANIGMCLVNLDGRLTRVNSQMCNIFGYKQEELESMTVNDIAHPEDQNISPKFIQRAASGEVEHSQFEKRYFHKQGHIVWGQVSSSLVRDSQGIPLYFISHVQDITKRKQTEEQLKANLAEREVMLKEIHHRVKNNLTMLIALIEMQAETMGDAAGRSALEDLQQRVMAMALIHERLYQSRDLAQINFGEFLEDLAVYLSDAVGDNDRLIALHVEAEKGLMPVNIAISCGLIVNELVTNALKYAFSAPPSVSPVTEMRKEGEAEIRVTFEARADEYVLTISDNGVGLPPELDWRATETLGLKLVNLLTTYQLKGSLAVDTQNGTAFLVSLPNQDTYGQS